MHQRKLDVFFTHQPYVLLVIAHELEGNVNSEVYQLWSSRALCPVVSTGYTTGAGPCGLNLKVITHITQCTCLSVFRWYS